MRTMLRQHEVDEELEPQSVDELRRKVAWQVSTAYGLPLEQLDPDPVPVPVVVLPEERELPLPSLRDLERLVAASSDEHPARADEWRWLLFYLRDFAGADGSIDGMFRELVETSFAPLLHA